jgi:chromate reductase
VLKNAIDWASRPFPDNVLRGKPAAVMGASTSLFGAVWAQAEVRKALGVAGARVLDRELAVPRAHEQFDARGEPVDGELRARLGELVRELLSISALQHEPLAA